MEIGETLYVIHRNDWRKWLEKNHTSEKEIWLEFPKKASGKPRLPYDDAVEEALCFGWIDSIIKKLSADSTCQRFTPRKLKSDLSELNKERIRRLIAAKKMTSAGMESIKPHLVKKQDGTYEPIPYKIPKDMLDEIKSDKILWEQFQLLPEYYKNIRIAFIDTARKRNDVFRQRFDYFKKMTRQGKRFGSIK